MADSDRRAGEEASSIMVAGSLRSPGQSPFTGASPAISKVGVDVNRKALFMTDETLICPRLSYCRELPLWL